MPAAGFRRRAQKSLKRRKTQQAENQKTCRDENHLALHSVAVKLPLVFADIVPCQKANAANHDQQHNRDIDYRTASIAGKGWIAVAFCPKNVKPGVAKADMEWNTAIQTPRHP